MEEQEEDFKSLQQLAQKNQFPSFVKKNFEFRTRSVLVNKLDSRIIYQDKDFFKILRKNKNVPSYLNDLKRYIQ